jgi:HK97 family phage major capsid protein
MVADRDHLLTMNRKLCDAADADGKRGLTDEEQATFDGNMRIADGLSDDIKANEGRQSPRQFTDTIPLCNSRGELVSTDGTRATTSDAPTTLRSIDGCEHRVFKKGQRLADHFDGPSRGMNLGDVGRGLAAIISGNVAAAQDEVRAMSLGLNTSGGILVTPEVSNLFIDKARDRSELFRLGATMIEMGSEQTRLARLTSDVTTSVTGENEAIGFTDAAFDSVNLNSRKIAGICAISKELAADAQNAPDLIIDSITKSMAQSLDTLALSGSGTGDGWLGILNDPNVTETGSIGAIDYDNLLDSLNLLQENFAPGEFGMLASSDVWTALSKLKTATELQYLTPPVAISDLLRGRTEKVVNTKAIVGQFDQVIFGMRNNGIQISLSDEAGDSFQKDQIFVKGTLRGDSNLMNAGFFNVLTGITY